MCSRIYDCRLKCNRDLPCDTCVKRKKPSLCHFAANASRSKPISSVPRDLKDRLENLENLVSSFLSDGSGIQHQANPDDETMVDGNENLALSFEKHNSSTKLSSTPGSLSKGEDVLTPEPLHLQETRDGQVNYIDPSHWQAILEDIKEVRDHLSILNHSASQSKQVSEINHTNSDPGLIFGLIPNADLVEILSSLPPQPICEMLISWYFNSRFMILGKANPCLTKALMLNSVKALYILSSFRMR